MQISGELMYGVSQHGVTTNDVSSAGPARAMLVVAIASIGALVFGGIGAAFASQGIPYLTGFGAALGLMCGIGVEVIRQPLSASPPTMTANELSTAVPARCLLVVAFSLTGALAFAGLGAAFASQGVAYLAGFGAALGMLFGIGMEVVYLGDSQNDDASAGPWRIHLMVAPTFIGALAFGGFGAGFASQGVPYLVGFGAALGLLCGVGVEVVRRPLAAKPVREVALVTTMEPAAPAAAGVMMFMDGMQTKKPGFDIDEASTAAGSFATDMSASLLSS